MAERPRAGLSARGPHAVERVMGTAIGIDVLDPAVPMGVVELAFASFRAIDTRFSPYLPDSEVSRLIRGEIEESEASADLRDILGLGDGLTELTSGYFDIRRHRPDGRPDPTGIVKGWAGERAARILDAAGADAYSINAGGDVIVRSRPDRDPRWRVGIRHPLRADRVAAVLLVGNGAVATSGLYERGAHIVDPHTGAAATGLLSLTVVGPSLTYADAFATAAFAMGRAGIAWVARQDGYGAYGITDDQRAVWTPLVDRLLSRSAD